MSNEYTIVSDNFVEDLEVTVRELIRSGWVPSGGLCVVQDYNDRAFYQAMVRAPVAAAGNSDHYLYKRRIND